MLLNGIRQVGVLSPYLLGSVYFAAKMPAATGLAETK